MRIHCFKSTRTPSSAPRLNLSVCQLISLLRFTRDVKILTVWRQCCQEEMQQATHHQPVSLARSSNYLSIYEQFETFTRNTRKSISQVTQSRKKYLTVFCTQCIYIVSHKNAHRLLSYKKLIQ